MAACKYPEEQAKVRAQIDRVVGRDRGTFSLKSCAIAVINPLTVPSKEDEPFLPRVVAFYLEAYRWRPVSWGGIHSPLNIITYQH